ncbi:exodeoxyribonuclease VII large subunit [Candidatus Saccharibacteria bacterium]|nr:MAG: exodeoxyribonuclease VII large subunit [Candidatus Saccharibacteria bacterium]
MMPRLSVSDFLAVVNQSLETAFGSVEVEGEVASFKVNQQKYVFFDLKDDDCTVGCFMMLWQMRMPLKDGMRVVVRAVPKLTKWGKFSLTVREIQIVGEGSLKKSYQILKKKLTDEGLFDDERKRSLPERPFRVAVISSQQAAGYADFIKILSERWGGMELLIAQVKVQGLGAADQMIKALEYVNEMSDLPEVVVLIRGGGSADDLAAFNDEKLVRAVAASRVPVLTGIGHETDESLVDLAADVQASTPSNAAQILVPDRKEIISLFKLRTKDCLGVVERAIDDQQQQTRGLLSEALVKWSHQADQALNQVQQAKQLAKEYDPEAVLRRGYALVEGAKKVGSVVKITTDKEIMKARVENYESR